MNPNDAMCIHESFPSEHAQSTDFIRSGKVYTSFNLLRIKVWFCGSVNTGRHCLLLQFHLKY